MRTTPAERYQLLFLISRLRSCHSFQDIILPWHLSLPQWYSGNFICNKSNHAQAHILLLLESFVSKNSLSYFWTQKYGQQRMRLIFSVNLLVPLENKSVKQASGPNRTPARLLPACEYEWQAGIFIYLQMFGFGAVERVVETVSPVCPVPALPSHASKSTCRVKASFLLLLGTVLTVLWKPLALEMRNFRFCEARRPSFYK